MAKKKKDSIEYRYYEIGQDEYVLALFGESWIRHSWCGKFIRIMRYSKDSAPALK